MNTTQEQISGILGETFANTKILVMFTAFALANLIGFSIQDYNLKICYWLSLTLVLVSIVNFNMAVSFYISLRNEKGIEGARGPKGDKGPNGLPGRCELNLEANCDIENCTSKIQDKLINKCPQYKTIVNKRDYDRTQEDAEILDRYTKWINVISEDCRHQTGAKEKEYFEKVFKHSDDYCLN
tara:strand:+ start:4926 stop:5474 length:549 start_codon:yes stop_codon:yes gene_type:complete